MIENKEFSEEQSWDYVSKHGTKFETRCDFIGGITVYVSDALPKEKLLEDVTEMIGCHSVKVRPMLKSFRGYRNVAYTFKHL